MDYYNKVIESVHVRFLKGNNFKIEKPVTVTNYVESENSLILLHHGTLKFGEDQELVNEGEVLFLPKGQKKRKSPLVPVRRKMNRISNSFWTINGSFFKASASKKSKPPKKIAFLTSNLSPRYLTW